MFVFRASDYLEQLERFAPGIVLACRNAVAGTKRDLGFLRLDAQSFSACPAESIDYALMEKTSKARVVPLDAGWSDVGSWSALWSTAHKNEYGDVSQGDVLSLNTRNSYMHSSGSRLLVTVGLEDMVVVETVDAVLVAHKSQVQHVKAIVEQLTKSDRKEAKYHQLVHRPWGTFDSIDTGPRYQVKRIMVTSGAKLSLQMHYHRAEHWVVVSGTAKVRLGETEMLLSENQSTYIPIGVVHSLENPGKVPLEIIEVQSGAYLGEDDIVRFDDSYGRVTNELLTEMKL